MKTSLPACLVEKFNMETDGKGVGITENAKVVEIAHKLATSESFFHHKSGATKAGIVFSEPKGVGSQLQLGWCIYSSLYIFLMYQIICHWCSILMEESNDKFNVNTLRYSVINIFSSNFNSLISWELETWKGASLHSWKSFFSILHSHCLFLLSFWVSLRNLRWQLRLVLFPSKNGCSL